jgi:hypothetical protein
MTPHRWIAVPEAGAGEQICDACGARPGTPEADGLCGAPEADAGGVMWPEPWDFWPGGMHGPLIEEPGSDPAS